MGARRPSAVVAGLLLLAALAGLGWLALTPAGRPPASPSAAPARPAAANAPPVPSTAPATAPAPARLASIPSPGTAAPPTHRPPHPEWGQIGPHRADPLVTYLELTAFPPDSRPLRPGSDRLHPDQRHEPVRTTHDDPGVTYLFTADRYFVVGARAVHATLQVWRDGAPAGVRITDAFIAPRAPGDPRRPPDDARVPVTFAPRGGALLARFRPARLLDLERPAIVALYVAFDHGGERPQRARLRFHVTPAAAVPARITGAFRDGVEEGSLVVHAGVEVHRPGHFVIDANLYDADDEPVAWARFKGRLEAGPAEVPLRFFGKALVDAGGPSPYRLGELRGVRYVAGAEPDLERMAPWEGTWRTAAWPLDRFSDAPWDSPRKRETIRFLRAARGGPKRGPAP